MSSYPTPVTSPTQRHSGVGLEEGNSPETFQSNSPVCAMLQPSSISTSKVYSRQQARSTVPLLFNRIDNTCISCFTHLLSSMGLTTERKSQLLAAAAKPKNGLDNRLFLFHPVVHQLVPINESRRCSFPPHTHWDHTRRCRKGAAGKNTALHVQPQAQLPAVLLVVATKPC